MISNSLCFNFVNVHTQLVKKILHNINKNIQSTLMLTVCSSVVNVSVSVLVVFSSLVDTTSTSFCSIMNGLNWPNEVNEGWLKGFYRFLSIIGSLFMAQLLSLADHDLSRLEKDKYQNKQKMPAFMRD